MSSDPQAYRRRRLRSAWQRTATMPRELPRVDLEHPSDLDFIVQAVHSYARDVGAERLRTRGRAAAALQDTLDQALARWVYAARTRLIPNVLVNGLTLAEYAKQETAMEPFDEALSQRVQALSDTMDEQTERVVDYRKSVPTAYAQAVARRAAARRALADAKEDQRQRRLRTSKRHAAAPYPAIARGQPLHLDADAKARAQATLANVYANLRRLHAALPVRQESALEQERLVRHLRRHDDATRPV